MLSAISLAALVVLIVGCVVLWSQPGRVVNRVVFTSSLHLAAWLLCVQTAVALSPHGLFWFKMGCAVGGAVPLHFWLVKEAIATDLLLRNAERRLALLCGFLATVFLSIVPFTTVFIPADSTDAHRLFGWGYHGYYVVVFSFYGFLLRDAFKTIRTLQGAQRLELQVWLVGGCAMLCLILLLMGLNALTRDRLWILLQPIVVIAFYTGTTIAITTYRIFDARQLLIVIIDKTMLVSLTALAAYFADWGLRPLLPSPFDILLTTAVALWFAITLNGWLDRVFQFYPQATVARQAVFEAARNETRVASLEAAFLGVLKGWGQTDRAMLLHGSKDVLQGAGVELAGDHTVALAMRQLRWVTPERLARERPTPERQAVAAFLREHTLGVLVAAEGPSLTALVGVGTAASRRPFTYPQVTQLQELASIVESALERAVFAAKAQHAEQLATVGLLGASLAHEIRNPLVTIKTFVQMLPQHHQDAAFRDKFFRLIGDEVGRIDRLTVQLLDLAAPRNFISEAVDLHPVMKASLDLVAAKAADKQIEFVTEFQAEPDRVFTDASAAKQVMLNLCFNAIQAVESHAGERWVKLSTRNVASGVEMAVADSGPGIAPEIRPRLFQPFQTTKSSGFGLGLAICSDILANVDATISVDPAAAGRGATFRVIFPCPASSS